MRHNAKDNWGENFMKKINLNVNGKAYEVEIEESMKLVELLRDKLHLMGTKVGCGEGECGACTVIMDGQTVASCLVLAFQADGSNIETIEGVGGCEGNNLIQQAFIEVGAVQCGFCIPGMVMSAKALLDHNAHPNEYEIREAISGNICRCTGYEKIVEAIALARDRINEGMS